MLSPYMRDTKPRVRAYMLPFNKVDGSLDSDDGPFVLADKCQRRDQAKNVSVINWVKNPHLTHFCQSPNCRQLLGGQEQQAKPLLATEIGSD